MKINRIALIIIAIISVLGIGLLLSVTRSSVSTPGADSRIRIATSFYPLYFFTKQIAGSHANVFNLTPAGAEPHDFEPTTQDIAKLQDASLLIINGAGVEPWAEKVKQTLTDRVTVVSVSDNILPKTENGTPDPHAWLDPVLAKELSRTITQAIIAVDPTNASDYRNNLTALEQQLDELDKSFRNGLSGCKERTFVTSHAAFGYLASRYNLRQLPIAGLSPDREPSLKDLSEITAFAKSSNVKYIFFETLVSPKLSQTIADEVGAQTLVLNPIEGLTEKDQSAGSDYFSIQQINLTNLQTALACR